MYEVVFTLVCACSGTSTCVCIYYVCVSVHVWVFICVCVCMHVRLVCVCVYLPTVNCLPDNYFHYSFSKALLQIIYSLMLTKKQIAVAIRSLETKQHKEV